jgi:hypothetical protein
MPGTVYDHDGPWSDEQTRDAAAHGRLPADHIARTDARTPAVLSSTPAGAVLPPDRRRRSSCARRGRPGRGDRPGHRPVLLRGGEEVATPFQEAFGDDVARRQARSVDLRRARARAAGCECRALDSARPVMETSSRTGATTARPGARE